MRKPALFQEKRLGRIGFQNLIVLQLPNYLLGQLDRIHRSRIGGQNRAERGCQFMSESVDLTAFIH